MQDAEAHAVPFPGLPGAARRDPGRVAAGRRQQRRHRERLRHRCPAAGVVVVAMAEHGRIQPAHAQRVQGRHHRTFAGIEAVPHRRPHVVQQAVARGPHQDRQPLPDIDHHQLHFAMARQVQRRMQQWQPQQQRQRLAGHSARQQQPERRQQCQRQREPARLRQPGHRQRAVGDPRERRPQQVEGLRGQPPAGFTPPAMQAFRKHAQQGQRNHHQAPPRHRRQVGQRAGERGLPEQHHGQRQQAQRGHRLRRDESAQHRPASPPLVRRQAPQQPRHPGKAEPESRAQYRQRIQQQQDDAAQREGVGKPLAASQAARRDQRRDHHRGTQGRQREAGHRRIRKRTGHRREAGGEWPRHVAAQAGNDPPRRRREQREEARDQADVEAGDRDQVGEPGRAQARPVAIVEATGIAKRQRTDEARGSHRQRRRDPPAHAFAPGIDPGRCREPQRQRRFQHVAGGRDARRHRLHFAIVATGVAQRLRYPQLHVEAPAAAGDQAGPVARIVVERPDPQTLAAQRRRLGWIGIHHEFEAGAADFVQRQADDAPAHLMRLALQRGRDLPVQRGRGVQPGEAEAEQQDPQHPRAPRAPRQRDPGEQRQDQQRPCRQERPPQAGAHASQQGRGAGGTGEWRVIAHADSVAMLPMIRDRQ